MGDMDRGRVLYGTEDQEVPPETESRCMMDGSDAAVRSLRRSFLLGFGRYYPTFAAVNVSRDDRSTAGRVYQRRRALCVLASKNITVDLVAS